MTYEMYKDKAGEWRWRLKVDNGNIIADSGQGYVNKADCERGIELVKSSSEASVIEG
jgi:uncharacterized protein YegP (UPF0339 family)